MDSLVKIEDLPAIIDGRFFHVATAIQSGGIFPSPDDIQRFLHERHGNLANLPAEKKKHLVWPRAALLEGLESGSIPLKSRQHAIAPLKAAEWLGMNFSPIDSVAPNNRLSELGEFSSLTAVPFYLGNGIFCTIHDLDDHGNFNPQEQSIRLAGFIFSKQAVLCSAFWSILIEFRTLPLLELGHRFKTEDAPGDSECLDFSREVCVWGGRGGIFFELSAHHCAAEIRSWLIESANGMPADLAVRKGAALKGLDISFASKHLRFVDPDRFATFDSLLAQAFNLDLTPRSYAQFLEQLRDIQQTYFFRDDLATIEHGFFTLLQPFYEANRLRDGVKLQAADSPLFFSATSATIDRDFVQIEEFSPEISLFHRKSQNHIYGFSRQPDARGRRQLAVLLLAGRSEDEHSNSAAFAPDFFGVQHCGLRTASAYRHLRWQMGQSNRFDLPAFESI